MKLFRFLWRGALRGVVGACAMGAGSAALGGCYDAPMWRGDALSREHIEEVRASGEDPLRAAHLEVLLYDAPYSEAQREQWFRRLIPLVLAEYDGDRREVGRALRSGDWALMLRILDVDALEGQAARIFARLLWLNGCAEEAVVVMQRSEAAPFDMLTVPLVLRDGAALRAIAAPLDSRDPLRIARAEALAASLEAPDGMDAALSGFGAALRAANGETEWAEINDSFGLDAALSVARGVPFPPGPEQPTGDDFFEWEGYLRQLTAIALWLGVSDVCQESLGIMGSVLAAPPEFGESWRIEAQVVTVFCALERG